MIEVSISELNEKGLSYSRTLTPLGAKILLVNQQSENIDITFFPQGLNGELVYIRIRGFVGTRLGREISAKPLKAREFRESDKASKVILH